MVEPGCEYSLLAPVILQMLAIGTSTSGMFQKASVPGPVGIKEVHLLALHKAFSVSLVSGFAFSPSERSGRRAAELSVGAAHHSCVLLSFTLPAAGPAVQRRGPGAAAHAGQALVCFLYTGVLIMGWGETFFLIFR